MDNTELVEPTSIIGVTGEPTSIGVTGLRVIQLSLSLHLGIQVLVS